MGGPAQGFRATASQCQCTGPAAEVLAAVTAHADSGGFEGVFSHFRGRGCGRMSVCILRPGPGSRLTAERAQRWASGAQRQSA